MQLRWWNAGALAMVLAVGWLADSLPLGGRSTGEISAMFPVLIMPAPYANAIWGLIYALLGCFVIYQLMPAKNKEPRPDATGPWFIVSCAFNAVWIVLWHYLFIESSVFIMFGLLTTLFVVYISTRSSSGGAPAQWFVQLPFSLYLGWMTVATLVNVAVVLYANDWSGWGLSPEIWTLIMLVAATLLAVLVGGRYVDPAYIAVFVWAFIAIGASVRVSGSIKLAAWLLAASLFVYALSLLRKLVR
ncbi:hypothetical protein [Paenibacillus sp. HJGM_3]|uniref:hypothetical protein n=1 Tax=Paenibacillus sp. HJGM_3 TaxID=3379816 RepID=UPI00385DB668